MCDLLVLAFRMDVTRVSTFMVARDGSDRVFRWLGLAEGHHTLSHHGSDQAKLDGVAKIDKFYAEQFAYFLQKMKSVKEGDKTLLDNSMILYGCGIGDGDRHSARFGTPSGLSGVCVYLLSQRFRNIHRYRFINFNWFVVNSHN